MRNRARVVVWAAAAGVGLAALRAGADDADKAKIEALEKRIQSLEQHPVAQAATPAPNVGGDKDVPPANWPCCGIWADPAATKDLGKLTGMPWLDGLKVRGWIDGYYSWNFNNPEQSAVDGKTNYRAGRRGPFGGVIGRDVSNEGRTFDIHNNTFAISLAEIEFEKVPEVGGVGFKFDLAFGETQDIIADNIRGALDATGAADRISDFDKTFQHASISYVAPIGDGLRIDFGKLVTHIGGETIETVKNWNYSHSWFYTYAIPFQDTGFRLHYDWMPEFYTEFYLLNGWNVTIDNNREKTFGPTIGANPVGPVWLYLNYLVGSEPLLVAYNDATPAGGFKTESTRHLIDTQLMIGPIADNWNFMLNYDRGWQDDTSTIAGKRTGVDWQSIAAFIRYKIDDMWEPSFRFEYYSDIDGATTGDRQYVTSVTATMNIKLGGDVSKGSMLLLRPEIRWDTSSSRYFSKGDSFRSKEDQVTLEMGMTWLF